MTSATSEATAMENKEMAPTLSTSQSVLEKPSPAPESIHSETKNQENKTEPASNEIVYPKMLTKVGVGVGLALAVFLVYPRLTLLTRAGFARSDHRRYCDPHDFR
jgi:hypothetical protein